MTLVTGLFIHFEHHIFCFERYLDERALVSGQSMRAVASISSKVNCAKLSSKGLQRNSVLNASIGSVKQPKTRLKHPKNPYPLAFKMASLTHSNIFFYFPKPLCSPFYSFSHDSGVLFNHCFRSEIIIKS